MNSAGAVILYSGAVVLGGIALARRDDSFRLGLVRAVHQVVIILPRMIFALIAASFIVTLIPTEIIVAYLGPEAGIKGILIGSLTGLIVPSGGGCRIRNRGHVCFRRSIGTSARVFPHGLERLCRTPRRHF